MKNDVLTGNTRAKLAFNVEQQAFRNLKPCFAGGIAHSSIGRTNASGECAQRTIGAGMAIGANDEVASAYNALLR